MFTGGLVVYLFKLYILYKVCKFVIKLNLRKSFSTPNMVFNKSKKNLRYGRYSRKEAFRTTKKVAKFIDRTVYDKIREKANESYNKSSKSESLAKAVGDYDMSNVIDLSTYKSKKSNKDV